MRAMGGKEIKVHSIYLKQLFSQVFACITALFFIKAGVKVYTLSIRFHGKRVKFFVDKMLELHFHNFSHRFVTFLRSSRNTTTVEDLHGVMDTLHDS